MKVTTDACLFGAWLAEEIENTCLPNGQGKLKIKNVLDIGAGTGLLSLMLAQKNPFAKIDSIEIDQQCCEQAKENVESSPFAKSIQVACSDVKTFSFSKKYDAIISNPPFYENEITSEDKKKNMAHHSSALLIDELLNIIKLNLSSKGMFFLLLPFKRNKELRQILKAKDLSISQMVFVKQSVKHGYFRIMIKGQLQHLSGLETQIEEISICDDQQQYSREFKMLLKDFYLDL